MLLANWCDDLLMFAYNIPWRIVLFMIITYSWYLSFRDVKYKSISQKMVTPIYIMSIALFFIELYIYHKNYADDLFKVNYFGIIANQLISVLAAVFILGVAHIQYVKRCRKISKIEVGYIFAISIAISPIMFIPIAIIILFVLVVFYIIANYSIRNRISQYIIFPTTIVITISFLTFGIFWYYVIKYH